MALYPIGNISHLYNDDLLMFEDDEFQFYEPFRSTIGTATIPPRINLALYTNRKQFDHLLDYLLVKYDKYKENNFIETREQNGITEISLKGIRNSSIKESYKEMLNVIISNMLARPSKSDYTRISISNDNIYQQQNERYNPTKLKPDKVKNLILYLALNEYIDLYYNNHQSKHETRYALTDKLLALFTKFNLSMDDVYISDNIDFVELKVTDKKNRNSSTAKHVPYMDTQETNYRREVLTEYNNLLADWKERINFKTAMPPILYARCIYNEAIGRGGRVYAHWQNLSGEQRGGILIDGSRVVEVDIKSCSLRIACHILELNHLDDDLYIIKNYPRADVKLVVQQMLNMKDRERSLLQKYTDITNSNELKESISNTDTSYIKQLATDIYDYYNADEMNNLSSKMFFQDKGMSIITPIESKITIEVIKEFTNDDELVLTIHDSFIVKEELESKLMLSLLRNYNLLLKHEPVLTLNGKEVMLAAYF